MEDDELLAEILPILEIDLHVVRYFEPSDLDGITRFRRVGRRAVRHLGHRPIIRQSDPAPHGDEEVRVVVGVFADAAPDHPDRRRVDQRIAALAWKLEGFGTDG